MERLQSPCVLCPRECRARRAEGEVGFCMTGTVARVSSAALHFGEESVLVGQGGSGTIFLSGCNLGCLFCQNYPLSHLREGTETSDEELASLMLALQARGAENINWVTPTHVVPQLVRALALATARGLRIPLVYNCGGYESPAALALLDGVVDIYMPDAKFADEQVAGRLCGVHDYFRRACRAIRIMHRQVGPLRVGPRGVAWRGLLVRHLVMPNGLAGSRRWAKALARITEGTAHVNVMAQYRPQYQAWRLPGLDRRITPEEYEEARGCFTRAGLTLVD